ncbi:outer envelope protein [Massilia sp. WF1]|uniref:outer envelope protein n=1 Tax=unclassified Massilia TaxID=2609279 RepID=UPI000649E0FE|nr:MULTISPECIES: outer envelope protein [unclassified Massilia]ALK97215.1 outer envelope protein [Massilia sp. WG5]KLU36397.1 outer envelope protein [Massilia sp. WF1]
MKRSRSWNIVLSTMIATLALPAMAADWSDTSIAWRAGGRFAEPFNANDIHKDIVQVSHASGYKYGSNFFNLDMLLSNKTDPSAKGASSGAQEFYVVYRHTLEWGKVTGTPMRFGPIKDAGLTFGFDANTKNDAGYNSKKRMLVAGPTFMVDAKGLLNVGIYELWESNAPYSSFTGVSTPRYHYDAHPMLGAVWAFPLGGTGLSFEGYANFIAAKGKNEFGRDTRPETNIDMQLMLDVGGLFDVKPKRFRAGLAYQYWRNKFGNDARTIPGATASTPMVKAQYHF